jgi:hypothetical protein
LCCMLFLQLYVRVLTLLVFYGGLTGRVLIYCSLLVSFWRSGVCLWSCFWFYEKWVPCDVNVNLNWNYEYLFGVYVLLII